MNNTDLIFQSFTMTKNTKEQEKDLIEDDKNRAGLAVTHGSKYLPIEEWMSPVYPGKKNRDFADRRSSAKSLFHILFTDLLPDYGLEFSCTSYSYSFPTGNTISEQNKGRNTSYLKLCGYKGIFVHIDLNDPYPFL